MNDNTASGICSRATGKGDDAARNARQAAKCKEASVDGNAKRTTINLTAPVSKGQKTQARPNNGPFPVNQRPEKDEQYLSADIGHIQVITKKADMPVFRISWPGTFWKEGIGLTY